MLPRLLRLHPLTYRRLIPISKEAEQEGAYRVAKRLQAVVLNSEGRTSGDLARILKAPRSKVSERLSRYQAQGVEGLLEGYRPARPARLSEAQHRPSARSSIAERGLWAPPRIWFADDRLGSEEEFGVVYHPGHVRKLLHDLGFSVSGPAGCWPAPTAASRTTGIATFIPALKKSRTENRALIFTNEASLRQDSTLHATWSRLGHPPEIPVSGERKSVKSWALSISGLPASTMAKPPSSMLPPIWTSSIAWLLIIAAAGPFSFRTTPRIIRTPRSGAGSSPTAPGWRSTNSLPTRPNSTHRAAVAVHPQNWNS